MVRAHVLAGAVAELQGMTAELVRAEQRRRPDHRAELARLRLTAIVVFRPDPADRDGYAGEFLILTDPASGAAEEWRGDLAGPGPQRLRPWE